MKFKRILVAILLLSIFLMIGSQNLAGEDFDIKLIISQDSLTLYFPVADSINIENLILEVVEGGRTLTKKFTDYTSFATSDNILPAPLCLRLKQSEANSPLSQDCNSSHVVTQRLTSSDVFWYSSVEAQYRTITIKWDDKVGICGAGQTSCEIILSELDGTLTPEPPSERSCIDIAQHSIPDSNESWIDIRNSRDDCIENKMVLVPMGVDTDAFWIDQYEVSQTDYTRCDHFDCATIIVDNGNHPVAEITIEQAEAYCIWRGTGEPGMTRLPTTEEWQYAAQGVDGWLYPWGNDSTNIEDRAIFETSSQGNPVNVAGELENSASWVGAYHMVGNIIEWVKSGSKSGQAGGSFGDVAGNIRTTFVLETDDVLDEVGFRCMREIDV